jgi:hypothetical protein
MSINARDPGEKKEDSLGCRVQLKEARRTEVVNQVCRHEPRADTPHFRLPLSVIRQVFLQMRVR